MSAIDWKPTWQQMRAAVRWSKANDKHIGDYSSVRHGAESYIQDLYIEQLVTDAHKSQRAIEMLRSHLSKSELYKVDYKLQREQEGAAELEIRRQWDKAMSALNLEWAKKLAKCKEARNV